MSHPFDETPQGMALLRRLAASTSRWAREDLSHVIAHARDHYQSQQHERLATARADSIPAEQGTFSMTIEATLERIAVALETIAKGGGSVSGGAAAAAKPAAAAKQTVKPTTSRDELAALANGYKEKTDADKARALIKEHGKADKLKEVADENVDALAKALKEATAAASSGDGL